MVTRRGAGAARTVPPVGRRKLDTVDRMTRTVLAGAAAELAASCRALNDRSAAVRAAARAERTARRDYVEAWEEFAAAVRAAHRRGVSVAELSRITGYGSGFVRPLALGLTTATRPQARRPRQRADDASR